MIQPIYVSEIQVIERKVYVWRQVGLNRRQEATIDTMTTLCSVVVLDLNFKLCNFHWLELFWSFTLLDFIWSGAKMMASEITGHFFRRKP